MLSLLLTLLLFQAPQVDPTYRIVPDDILDVSVFGQPELGGAAIVGANGYVALPRIGPIQAAGLDTNTLAHAIEDALRKDVLVDPRVIVSIKQVALQQVILTGAAKGVGVYSIRRGQGLLETLTKAGGLGENAGATIEVTRPSADGAAPQVIVIDTEELFEKASGKANIALQGGDLITISRGQPIFVNGEVKKPGDVQTRYGKTAFLRDVIQAGGGPTDRADVIRITRSRTAADSGGAARSVRIEDLLEKSLPEANLTVYSGDIVNVLPGLPIVVIGEVKKAGEVTARFGKSVPLREVLQQSGGLSERAGNTVRISRLDGADAITVSIEELVDRMKAEANIDVAPGSLVTIPPAIPITVLGEVRKPGDVLVRKALPLRELLQTAGGLTERAGSTIRISHPASAAASGADARPTVETIRTEDLERLVPTANVQVLPGDTVTVLSAISISLLGEVRKPGDVPTRLGQSVPLRDVIQQGNGFTDRVGGTIIVGRGANAPATEPRTTAIRIEDLIQERKPEANIDIYPGDSVSVTPALPIQTVGQLIKPGEFPTTGRRSLTVKDVVFRSYGVTKDADLRQSLIIRVRDDGRSEYIPLNLERISKPDFQDTLLEPNDILYVPVKKKGVISTVVEAGLSIAVAAATQRLIYFGR